MKLITWNVQWFCGLDDVVSVERVVEHARALADFDVICMQEVAMNYPDLPGGAAFDQPQRLRECLPGFEVHFAPAVRERGRDGRWQEFGNLIATRIPAAQFHAYTLPYPSDGGVRSMPRSVAAITIPTAGGPLRIMTTHLEFYSNRQRHAQVNALRELHDQASAHARTPPLADETGWPFQSKPHTTRTLLTGDFNFEPGSAEYERLQAPFGDGTPALMDAWHAAHSGKPHDPTFRLFDRRYGPEPIVCDFIFSSTDIAQRVSSISVDLSTKASDHQPVLIEIDL
jgi:endonuclease/exonuclease/phosphatase family metal-dependent hydrolase